jgi:hypothetical protein
LEKAEIFFESYNIAVETAYDKYFKVAEKDILKGIRSSESELKGYLECEIIKWQETTVENLNGKTPVEHIQNIDSFSELMDLFYNGAIICDDGLPDIFLNRLKEFGSKAEDALLKLSQDKLLLDNSEEEFLVPLMAVKILGDWKVQNAVNPLIELLFYQGENHDIFSEKVKDALISIGKPALESIMLAMEARGFTDPAGEYLLMALSDIGSLNKTDVIYKHVKNALYNMPNKIIGAICLGNYGDSRAIPALRGFLEKNKGDIDKETQLEIISSIRHLGGNTDDLGF